MPRTLVKWLFATYLLGSGIVWSILILPLFPFVGRRGRYWLARQWCRAVVVMMRVIVGVTCSVEGLEHLPDGPFIMLCRHESTWETLTFMALFPRRISFVFKRELKKIPFFGWVLVGLDMVSLDRGSLRQAHQAVTRECAEKLALGDAVVIFPEGTRVARCAAQAGFRRRAARVRDAGAGGARRARCGQGMAGEEMAGPSGTHPRDRHADAAARLHHPAGVEQARAAADGSRAGGIALKRRFSRAGAPWPRTGGSRRRSASPSRRVSANSRRS
ncbi:phospholipid/glycerol acyltransferase [Caballeronia humi]|uniref:Phospholipid/glycerol acyltransferase n=1 Tax=Caballeronia humi TaxID=326474 RepID=A0A158FWM1_9BURK|nr:phospholipid/glycerol acyltransferase [Caballeronia humi]